jgi:hypothetical protein
MFTQRDHQGSRHRMAARGRRIGGAAALLSAAAAVTVTSAASAQASMHAADGGPAARVMTAHLGGAGAGTAASASDRAPCVGQDSYALSTSSLAACGIAAYPTAATSRLSDGGSMVTYRSGAQTVFTVTPPRGEDMAAVSQPVRDLYGLPGPPSAHGAAAGAETRSRWQQHLRSLRWVPAPGALHDVPGVRFGNTPESWPAWTGYTANESTGYFHYAYLIFTEPTHQSATCDPADGAVFWTGLGGVNNTYLGQDGTAQGQFNGLAEDQGWIETDVGPVTASTVRATEGQQMSVTTIYETNYDNSGKAAYIYNFENIHTGASQSLGTWDTHFSGATADWIAERPETHANPDEWEDLSGFGTMQFTWAAAAVQQYPVSHYPYSNWEMYDGQDMADSSTLSSSGYSFTSTHHHCNQGS